MISRSAEQCFWLLRYLERLENTARLLQVNLVFVLDGNRAAVGQWRPVLIAAGEEEAFLRRHPPPAMDDGELVQEFLTWAEECPVAIVTSLRQAREDARTIRDTISLESWHAVNTFWLWLTGGQGRRLYQRDRYAFFERVKASCQHFHGVYHTTMLHERPFDFMRLGSLLERSGQIIRILDAMYHHPRMGSGAAGQRDSGAGETPWLGLLRSCSALEAFYKRGGTPSGPAVAEFLLFDGEFPRSLRYCLERSAHFLRRIESADASGSGRPPAQRSPELIRALVERMRSSPINEILAGGLGVWLGRRLAGVEAVCEGVAEDYFGALRPSAADPVAAVAAGSA